MTDLFDIKEKKLKEIFGLIDGMEADTIKTDGITVRAGKKILKFDFVSEEYSTVEDEIRNEFKEKLKQKIEFIRDKVDAKISEQTEFIHQQKKEFERKEYELKNKLRNVVSMPNVTLHHAKRGLSVVKNGDHPDRLVWLVRAIFWPKTVDGKIIEPKFSKKMLTPIIILIETLNESVVSVSTRKPIGLDYFDHYHQSNPDCWGDWKHKSTWRTPDDIIHIAKEAEAVLTNINTRSIAIDNPSGLPRKSTLLNHILKPNESEEKKLKMGILNQVSRRSGISNVVSEENTDVWST